MQEERELKKAKSRIIMINDDIRNNLTSLSLEGNFTEDTVSFYMEEQNRAINYEQDMKKIRVTLQNLNENTAAELRIMAGEIELKVKIEDVVTQLNIETDGIYFRSKLFLVDTDNFKVTENSCYLNGTIYGESGSIGGWSINGNSLVGYYNSPLDCSLILGGEIHADVAYVPITEFTNTDFNPNYSTETHNINMQNAIVRSTSLSPWYEDTQFTDLTVLGAVTCAETVVALTIHCTGLIARDNDGYRYVNCDEIVTDDETFSDERLKTEIRDVTEEDCGALLELRPVTFDYRKTGRPGCGFIAQEVLPIAKEYGFESVVSQGRGFYALTYRQFLPLIIKQIQINQKRMEELKNGRKDRL